MLSVFTIKGLFGWLFLSLNFRHSSLITHHSSLKIPHPIWHHHSIFFTLFVGPIPVTWSEQSYFVTHHWFSSPSASSFLISPHFASHKIPYQLWQRKKKKKKPGPKCIKNKAAQQTFLTFSHLSLPLHLRSKPTTATSQI